MNTLKNNPLIPGYAKGGNTANKHIPGPTDTVLTNLQPKGFVIKKAMVDKYGVDFLNSLKAKVGQKEPDKAKPVQALVTPGEYYFSPTEAKAIGYPLLKNINEGKLEGFALGGEFKVGSFSSNGEDEKGDRVVSTYDASQDSRVPRLREGEYRSPDQATRLAAFYRGETSLQGDDVPGNNTQELNYYQKQYGVQSAVQPDGNRYNATGAALPNVVASGNAALKNYGNPNYQEPAPKTNSYSDGPQGTVLKNGQPLQPNNAVGGLNFGTAPSAAVSPNIYNNTQAQQEYQRTNTYYVNPNEPDVKKPKKPDYTGLGIGLAKGGVVPGYALGGMPERAPYQDKVSVPKQQPNFRLVPDPIPPNQQLAIQKNIPLSEPAGTIYQDGVRIPAQPSKQNFVMSQIGGNKQLMPLSNSKEIFQQGQLNTPGNNAQFIGGHDFVDKAKQPGTNWVKGSSRDLVPQTQADRFDQAAGKPKFNYDDYVNNIRQDTINATKARVDALKNPTPAAESIYKNQDWTGYGESKPYAKAGAARTPGQQAILNRTTGTPKPVSMFNNMKLPAQSFGLGLSALEAIKNYDAIKNNLSQPDAFSLSKPLSLQGAKDSARQQLAAMNPVNMQESSGILENLGIPALVTGANSIYNDIMPKRQPISSDPTPEQEAKIIANDPGLSKLKATEDERNKIVENSNGALLPQGTPGGMPINKATGEAQDKKYRDKYAEHLARGMVAESLGKKVYLTPEQAWENYQKNPNDINAAKALQDANKRQEEQYRQQVAYNNSPEAIRSQQDKELAQIGNQIGYALANARQRVNSPLANQRDVNAYNSLLNEFKLYQDAVAQRNETQANLGLGRDNNATTLEAARISADNARLRQQNAEQAALNKKYESMDKEGNKRYFTDSDIQGISNQGLNITKQQAGLISKISNRGWDEIKTTLLNLQEGTPEYENYLNEVDNTLGNPGRDVLDFLFRATPKEPVDNK